MENPFDGLEPGPTERLRRAAARVGVDPIACRVDPDIALLLREAARRADKDGVSVISLAKKLANNGDLIQRLLNGASIRMRSYNYFMDKLRS